MPQRELNVYTSTHVTPSDERPRPHCQWCCAPTTWNSCRLVHVSSSENNVRTSAKWGEIERDAVIHFLLKNCESHSISFDAVTGSVTTRQRISILWQQKLRILFDMMQSKHSGGWMKKRIFKDNFALLFFSVCQGFWNRHSRSSGERWQDICHFPPHPTTVESTSPSANREFKLWKEKTSKEKWINLCKYKFAAGVGTFFPVVAFFCLFSCFICVLHGTREHQIVFISLLFVMLKWKMFSFFWKCFIMKWSWARKCLHLQMSMHYQRKHPWDLKIFCYITSPLGRWDPWNMRKIKTFKKKAVLCMKKNIDPEKVKILISFHFDQPTCQTNMNFSLKVFASLGKCDNFRL